MIFYAQTSNTMLLYLTVQFEIDTQNILDVQFT